jgi:hypothetical protein
MPLTIRIQRSFRNGPRLKHRRRFEPGGDAYRRFQALLFNGLLTSPGRPLDGSEARQ